jgi:TPR repeat protein
MKRWLLPGGIVLAFLAGGLVMLYYASHSTAAGSDGARADSAKPVDVAALRAQAEAGQASARVQLGNLYANGEFVTNSYGEAAKWYEKAAAQGDAEAERALGELYEAGRGVAKDMTQAIKLYRAAAEHGNAGAQYTMGFLYEAGRGLPVDQAEATRWYQRAAERGEPLAQYDLGQRYDLGVGVPADPIEAYKWVALAAAQGQPDSVARLKKIKARMTKADLSEAKRRLAAFSPKTSASQ